MNTAETLDSAISRRDFVLPFANKKRRPSGTPPLRHTITPQSEPPRFSRRQAIPIIAVSTVAAGAAIARILNLWEWLSPEETLEALTTEAKSLENQYKLKDLSDKPTREKFAGIMAGIFAFHYPDYFSRQELTGMISWADTLDQFARQRMASAGKTGNPTKSQMEQERETTALTDNRRRKITVNAAAEPFHRESIKTIPNAPKTWNPLKMLRISLLHEFGHLVKENEDQIIFSIVDPENKFRDKRIEGFRFIGVDETGRFATSFNDLHEAVIELLAKDISLSDFGSHLSDMPSETSGITMDSVMNNLEQVLKAIDMDHKQLAELHKISNLSEFFIILADKAGASSNVSLKDKVSFGSRIARIIVANDQSFLQNYLNQVRSINPTSSQK